MSSNRYGARTPANSAISTSTRTTAPPARATRWWRNRRQARAQKLWPVRWAASRGEGRATADAAVAAGRAISVEPDSRVQEPIGDVNQEVRGDDHDRE